MEEFNKEEAKKILSENPDYRYVSQDRCGEVYIFKSFPVICGNHWEGCVPGDLGKFVGRYKPHSRGWENSKFSIDII